MRSETVRILGLSLTLVILAGSAAPAGQDVTFHFLKVEGKAYFLEMISVNGKLVIRTKLISLDLPLYVTTHLQQGSNTLEFEYTSHSTEGLKILIEERRRGSPEKKEIVKFSSAAGETQGRKVMKVIGFTTHLKFPQTITLDEADRQAILGLIKAYHSALAARNSARVLKFTERATKEESDIYPEGMKFHQAAKQALVGTAFSIPNFKMQPLQLEGLRFLVDGDVAVVVRPQQLPVILSDEYDVKEKVCFVVNGRQVRTNVKQKFSIAPKFLHFKKYGGEWHFTVHFGLVSLFWGASPSLGCY